MTTINNQDTFLAHRKAQEKSHFKKTDGSCPLDSILTIELNTTELCNRRCVFCPRHSPEVYPNRNLHMTVRTAESICISLADAEYQGKISFSGYSENLMNPDFADIVSVFRTHLPDCTIECNTNGDYLSTVYVENLFSKGLDLLYINLYDGAHQIEHFDEMMQSFSEEKYKYRMHWSQKDHGLILNNRSGTIDWIGIEDSDVESLQGKPCHYPFYKMFVDWNGDVLFCANDWGKEHVVGNIAHQSLWDVWMSSPLRRIRRRLIKGNRTQSPCDKCSVDGTLFGKPSFEILKKYEDNHNRHDRTRITVHQISELS